MSYTEQDIRGHALVVPNVGGTNTGDGYEQIHDSIRAIAEQSPLYAERYDAVGDGVTDDRQYIQAAIDDADAGDEVVLELAKTYRLTGSGSNSGGLTIGGAVSLHGRGATLKLNTSATPVNFHIYAATVVGSPVVQWDGIVVQGNTITAPGTNNLGIPAGTLVRVELGRDPGDVNEQHFVAVCKVLANTSAGTNRTITIDRVIPYATNNAVPSAETKANRIRVVTSRVADSEIDGLVMDWDTGIIPDTCIVLDGATNMRIADITGRVTDGIRINDSSGVTVEDCHVTCTDPTGYQGRFLVLWQCDNVIVRNCSATTDADAGLISLESLARNLTIENVLLETTCATPTKPIFTFGADTATVGPVRGKGITTRSVAAVTVFGGADGSDFFFEDHTHDGPILQTDLSKIGRFCHNGTAFNRVVKHDYSVALTPGSGTNVAYTQVLCGALGAVRRAWARVSGVTGAAMQSAYFRYAGVEFGTLVPTNGAWVQFMTGGYGTNYPANKEGVLTDDRVDLYTYSNAAGGTLHLCFDLFPGSTYVPTLAL